MKKIWMAALAMLAVPVCAHSQAARRTSPAAMARADSAYDRGDRARARILYADVLAHDSSASRAVFRLAQLDESEERALALYRRYIALEPGDAWGHMAEGDLLGRMGRVDEALVAYAGASAVAPRERDVFIGRARLLERAGRSEQAAAELESWLSLHPADGEAWDLLGRSELRAGRPRSATEAFNEAAHRHVRGSEQRLNAASAASAPVIAPVWTSLGDSDGNRTTKYGVALDVVPMDGLRVGAFAGQEVITAPDDESRGTDLSLRLTSVPSRGVNFTADVGTIRYGRSAQRPGPRNAGESWTALHAGARVRVRAPADGPSIDLRLERAPIGFNPTLVANEVTRSEARAILELPVGAFRARGSGRLARIESAVELPNRRASVEGALLLPLGSQWLPSVQYRVTGFEHASAAGYFAPRSAETAEAGLYAETGEDGRLSMAVDVGAGVQRVTSHGATTGNWAREWRLWSQAALAFDPSRSWYVEIESYDAPFAFEGTATGGNWRYLSVASGFKWTLR